MEKHENTFKLRERKISALPEPYCCETGRNLNKSLHRLMLKGLISGSEKTFLEVCFKIVGLSLLCNQQLPVSLKKHMGSWILASLDVLAVFYLSF